MNNKVLGNNFEKEMAQKLKDYGYWVLLVTPKSYTNSQPMDIVAAKNNTMFCFECKTLHSKNKKFNLNRLEENQRLSWKILQKTGNQNYFLAVKWNDSEIYIIPFKEINFTSKYIELIDKYKIKEE